MNRNERDKLCEELIDHYQELSERGRYVQCPLYYNWGISIFVRRDKKRITEEWCDEAGRTPVTINSFGKDIKRLNPDIEVKKSNGIKLYKNIVVHEEWITKF